MGEEGGKLYIGGGGASMAQSCYAVMDRMIPQMQSEKGERRVVVYYVQRTAKRRRLT